MSDLMFSSLALSSELIDNLATLGYAEMTPIQAQSLPPILQGQDLIGQAKTGSGKTVAFGLGVLNNVDVNRYRIQALVLCPTRELAEQVATELRKLARATHNLKVLALCGGSPFGPQAKSLKHGAHIIIGTPGRVEDHLRKGNFRLNDLNTFVLDEADRMLDAGFQAALDEIARYIPAQRQTLLFSATYPPAIQAMANRVMRSPVFVEVAEAHEQSSIEQRFYRVEAEEARLAALVALLLHYRPQSSLVFCNTKAETIKVANALVEQGFSALALHGDMDQKDRDKSLVRFANKSVSICVATDVAARGLDIEALDAVVNYDIARELAVHTHRIGRTGRAGAKGIALTLATEKQQFKVDRLKEQSNSSASIDDQFQLQPLPAPGPHEQTAFKPQFSSLLIDGGKKHKLRAGDILGALTASSDIRAGDIGKIKIFSFHSYVAVKREVADDALTTLSDNRLKGKHFRVKRL